MIWGILVVVIILLLISYVIIQETRAQLHWRGLVQEGDVEAIRTLVTEQVDAWRTARVPKGVPPMLWHGVQTLEVADVTAKGAHLNCSVEGEYSFVSGRRVETESPLDAAKRLTMKLADMMMYEIPNVKLDHYQFDVYTSFRVEGGSADTRCILSTLVRRHDFEDLDWEQTDAEDFVALAGGRYAGRDGNVESVEPLDWDAADGAGEKDS
jgi:hypothetical protein